MKNAQGEEMREFSCMYKELDDLYHSIAKKIGISDSAFEVLYAICVLGDGCSQTDICEQAFVIKQTLNSAIRKLEREQKLIYKTKGKGRTLHIHLTEQGRRFVEQRIYPVLQMENNAFRHMDKAESQELLRLTRKYLAGMREEARGFLEPEDGV